MYRLTAVYLLIALCLSLVTCGRDNPTKPAAFKQITTAPASSPPTAPVAAGVNAEHETVVPGDSTASEVATFTRSPANPAIAMVESTDVTGVNRDDLIALIALFNTTDGQNWTNSVNWLSNEPMEAWFGVTTGAEGRVTELDLANNNLTGTLPPALGGLSSLKRLSLAGNSSLSGILPRALSYFPLDTLNVEGTELCALPDATFQAWLSGLQSAEGVVTCQDLHPDMEALYALFSATNGVSWEINSNWLSDAPLSEWHGVNTDSDGRVVSLVLGGNNLSGPIPTELRQLTHLQTLDLNRNNLSGPIPVELSQLSQLHTLELAVNTLSGPIPTELGQLTQLQTLIIGSNTLSGPIPAELGQLTQLQTFDLRNNILSGPIPVELGQLTQLLNFSLRNNTLSGPIPADLGQFTQLLTFDLAYNNLSGPIPAELGQFTQSLYFDLAANALSGSIPAELGELAQLASLELQLNALSGPVPAELGELTRLRELDLSGNTLSGTIPAELGQLTQLTLLDLSGNEDLTGILPRELTALINLETLTAGGTGLCAPSAASFQTWLRSIPNWWVPSCIPHFTKAAYLTQAAQSFGHPVPLVAGEDALLRVFVSTEVENAVSMPPARATFYLGEDKMHVIDIPAGGGSIPSEVDETSLAASINARVPGSVVMPGLEMVIEIDPEMTLDIPRGIAGRIPSTGRRAVDVRSLPPLNLTMVPFLWTESRDLSVWAAAEGLTADSELLRLTRYILPVQDLHLSLHDPVWTSIEPVQWNDYDLGPELEVVYAVEGRKGHYMGLLREGGGFSLDIPSRLSFSILDANVIAHELGRNFNLWHADCGGALGPDPIYPYEHGSTGTWGYDFLTGTLVRPDTPDLMSYCEPAWISDYQFVRALTHRLSDPPTPRFASAIAASSRGLLLWGGRSGDGDLALEPAFVVDASPTLPREDGPYRLTGESDAGSVLFTLNFSMSEYVDTEGGSFAFILPVRGDWPLRLARITLSGPEGSESIVAGGDRYVALVLDRDFGTVRGILRDWVSPGSATPPGRRIPPEPGMTVVVSGGIPDPDLW